MILSDFSKFGSPKMMSTKKMRAGEPCKKIGIFDHFGCILVAWSPFLTWDVPKKKTKMVKMVQTKKMFGEKCCIGKGNFGHFGCVLVDLGSILDPECP